MKGTGEYPPNWDAIALGVKELARWVCVRCNHPHDVTSGHVLTVHHLDMNKANCAWWNMVPLCQRCHLQIQGKVIMDRQWWPEHSDWFIPYVCGYYAAREGLELTRGQVEEWHQELLSLGQPWRIA